MDAEAPAGWQLLRLAECVERIISGATPKAGDPRYYGAGTIPFARIEDVVAAGGRPIDRTELAITEDAVRETAAKVYPAGTALMTMYGTIGAVAVTARPMAANQAIAAFVGPQIDARFLLHMLRQEAPRLARLAGQTTQANISGQILKRHVVSVPKERGEQQRIANILDAIDDAIEKTEAVVAATEDLRKALLQDLLTRGVPGWHTEWKTVQGIGTIPACWDVVRLGEVSGPFQYGTSAKCDDNEEDTPILRIPNVARGELELSDLKYAALPARDLEALRLQEGDLLFVRTNGNPDICGRTALVGQLEGDWAFASYLVRLRTSEDLSPFFLRLYLSQENGRRALSRHVRTSAGNFNLSVSGVRQLEMPLPPMPEQERVCELIRKVDDRLKQDRHLMTRIRGIKREIAGALLFGRVRVPVTTEAT